MTPPEVSAVVASLFTASEPVGVWLAVCLLVAGRFPGALGRDCESRVVGGASQLAPQESERPWVVHGQEGAPGPSRENGRRFPRAFISDLCTMHFVPLPLKELYVLCLSFPDPHNGGGRRCGRASCP